MKNPYIPTSSKKNFNTENKAYTNTLKPNKAASTIKNTRIVY